jgi:CelD/BcsL family acetyltransferase involved in cellulose biosynthesis
LGGRGKLISEFEASLVHRVSSRTARATQRNPVSKKKKKKKKKKRRKEKKKGGVGREERVLNRPSSEVEVDLFLRAFSWRAQRFPH